MGYLNYDEKKVLKWVNELYNIITSTLKNKVRKSQLKVVQHYYISFFAHLIKSSPPVVEGYTTLLLPLLVKNALEIT